MNIELRQLEDIVVAISSNDGRIIGFTTPDLDNAVSSISQSVAEFLARSRQSVLLINFLKPIGHADDDSLSISDALATDRMVHSIQCLDIIEVHPGASSPYVFADTAQLRQVLAQYLESYQFVILQLGPVLTVTATTLNPLPIGAACDYVLLTCKPGSVRRQMLRTAVARLQAARCRIAGVVLNESGYASVGAQIARVCGWILWPLPWLRKRVQAWALTSELLN
ncbi:hypothetical protein SAZ10_15065 [Mesorhizobium sp. BAC0120]|uniref:hypothetical protein n=1 Tax=Mesorhizobium sp. BAC0120 TaxID=3090670 RepID=UPI00298C368A|nr:hypothetical protein [Mesorhizobium sp. BAC0120]MDW6023080.1 hypothetical protein [Mesorhizobium sp. BAC0120]